MSQTTFQIRVDIKPVKKVKSKRRVRVAVEHPDFGFVPSMQYVLENINRNLRINGLIV
jgi:hypothetical protein